MLPVTFAFEATVFQELFRLRLPFDIKFDLPGFGKDGGVRESGFLGVVIGVLQSVALHHVKVLIDEISGHVQPRPAVEVRHIDGE